jgi:hypothetical protein
MADHVADLGAVSGIVGGLSSGSTSRAPSTPSPDGEATAKQPQSNNLEKRQFGGQGPQPSTSTAYTPKHAAGKALATDVVAAA